MSVFITAPIKGDSAPKDPVRRWNNGVGKQNFEEFVQKMTGKGLSSLTQKEWEKVAFALFKKAFGGPLRLDPENRIEDVFGYIATGKFESDILKPCSSRDAPFSRPKMPPDFLSHRHDMTDSERLTAWRTDFTGNCFHRKGNM